MQKHSQPLDWWLLLTWMVCAGVSAACCERVTLAFWWAQGTLAVVFGGAWAIRRVEWPLRWKNFWWKYQNRCKNNKPGTARFPTAYMVQQHLAYLHSVYCPCKVCGNCRCRWAVSRPSAEARALYMQAMDRVQELRRRGCL